MAGLSGDVRTLKNLAKQLGLAGSTVVAQRVAARVAPELTALNLASFDAGQTPYGDAWEPGRDGRDVDLVKSGATRASVVYVAIGTRVRCVLGPRYLKFQIGRRGILPRGGQTLPGAQSARIREIAAEEIRASLGVR